MQALVRAKSWLFDIFAHNHAEQLRIQRAAQRQHMGLEQQDYPYPGAVQGSNNPTVTNVHQTGWLKGAVLGAALLAGGAAGTLALSKPSPAPSQLSTSTVDKAAPGQAYDAVYEEQNPDGSWRQVKRERLTLGK